MTRWFVLPALVGLIAACEPKDSPLPPPQPLTADAVGHFCTMNLVEHPGPKAQVFVEGQDRPLWFPAVRDMFAYTMMPGSAGTMRVAYVSDTGRTPYADATPEAWVEASQAYYAVGASVPGGMGLPEAVPFAAREDAERFVARHGGRLQRFEDVSPDWVFDTSGLGSAEANAKGGPS